MSTAIALPQSRVGAKFFLFSGVILGIHLLVGLIAAAQYVWPAFLADILPFNMARMLHINGLVVWLLAGFMGATYLLLAEEAALETAKVRLSYTQIRAAWETGGDARYVGERFVNPGAMLSSNTAILSVIELQPITAVIHVTEKDYFRLKPAHPLPFDRCRSGSLN